MKRDEREEVIYRALQGVETPEYDILGAVKAAREEIPRRRRPHLTRAALLAACLAAALTVGALAAGLTVGWDSFLGRTPAEGVTAVGERAVTGEYTLTLREAIVDDEGAAFLLALTRNDGGVLEGKPRLSGNLFRWDVKVEGEKPNMSSGSQQPILSADGRTLYYCVEFEGQEMGGLMGKTITFLCRGVADMEWSEEEIETIRRETVSLLPLASTARKLEESHEALNSPEGRKELIPLVAELSAQATVPLTKLGEGGARVSAVLFTGDGRPMVAVGNRRGQVRRGQYLTSYCTAGALIDTRTGERWGCTGYTWVGDEEEGFYLCDFDGCPMTVEDLPYLELTANYGAEKVLSDEPVELSFSTGVGHQVIAELDESVEFHYYGDCTVHVTGAKLSALRVSLTVDSMERAGWDWTGSEDNTRWVLLEKDGGQIPLTPPKSRVDGETGTGQLLLEGYDRGERLLMDPDQAEALLVGEKRIPLQ